MADRVIKVYPNEQWKSDVRRYAYTAPDGSIFRGTRKEAISHFQTKYPANSISVEFYPKKRK